MMTMNRRSNLLSPLPMFRSALPILSLALLAGGSAFGQEYVLKNGRRLPADYVKGSGDSYTAVMPGANGAAPETVNFAVKDLASVSNLVEPAALREGRRLLATGKLPEARASLETAVKETADLKSVSGSWWSSAVLALMDTLSASGKTGDALSLASTENLAKVPADEAGPIRDMASIVNAKTESDAKAIAASTTDSWIQARARLRVGDMLSGAGKLEEAVMAYLLVPVFNAPEQDLAFRATVSAARGLQQIHRAEDGVKLLDDYLADGPPSSFKSLIQTEKTKLLPPKKDDSKSHTTPGEKKDQSDTKTEESGE